MNLADHADGLPRYRDFHPTGFDRHIHVDEIEDFIIVAFRSRDSKILEECNFQEILKYLGGESDTVQVHRFGHWGCGWFEQILVHPDLSEKAAEIACALADYPIWDDEAFFAACLEAAEEEWRVMWMRHRIALCDRAGASIFAARREFPEGSVLDLLMQEVSY